ncbi:hypothetical protein PB1_04555 [Bacillus methanolicus PB1]|uniref:Glyoxalase/bleomycin resistance protein/dioxygenase n=1 Tax=Bacillus methanolicus PB1 TaxID=997296 RepID=I3E6Q6_BACMT|nr:hypothetical protein PB1_04555 [Bacillus methanolicus PB1]
MLEFGYWKAYGVQFESEPKQKQWGAFATFLDEDGNSYVLKG